MAFSLASINIRFAVDLASLSTGLQNASRKLEAVSKQFDKVGRSLSTYVTAPLLAAGGASINFASDFNESQNKVSVAFKDSAGQVNAFAKTTLSAFGIAEGSALDMASLFGDMATSMGLTTAQAAQMSTGLVGLAGDLASFKNISIGQATTALNGVFTGETESLKTLGIVMTETNLAQFALSKGITKNLKDFSQAEKVQLRYAYVMAQTTNAQGDFARTGGGAANQARVLQEGLKELAAQIGQVILPAFTSIVKGINEFIGKLKAMSPETRTAIVVFAGIAAAIGPVILGISGLIKSILAVRTAITAFSASLAANPFTAIAVGLAAVATYAVIATSSFTPLTNAQKEFSQVMKGATESIAGERAEFAKNLSAAKNDLLSKEQRLQAVKNLNALSPQYLGNLTLENINTAAATKATTDYNAALLQKARLMAAQEKLVDVQKRLLDLQTGQSDAVKPSVLQNFQNVFRAFGNLNNIKALTTATVRQNIKDEGKELKALEAAVLTFIQKNDTFATSQGAAAAATNALNIALGDTAKAGTIKYYDEQIKGLQKMKEEFATTPEAVDVFNKQIDVIQAKLDKLNGKHKQVTAFSLPEMKDSGLAASDSSKRVAFLRQEQEMYIKLQEAYSATDDQYKTLQALIDGYDFTIKLELDPSSVITAQPLVTSAFSQMTADYETLQKKGVELAESSAIIGQALGNAFDTMAQGIAASVGQADDGFSRFVASLLSNIAKVISGLLSQAIANSIAGASSAAATTGPAAPVTLPVFIAEMVAAVIGAFAAIPKFETGGIVGGSSFHGDRILARLNSGEMVLNQAQQRRVFDMIEPAASDRGVAEQIIGEWRLSGDDLALALKRNSKKKNRTE